MVLVDTSVLIDFLKGVSNEAVTLFDEVLARQIPYGINYFIYQEVLQGARNQSEFNKLKSYLETIPFYNLPDRKESYEKAAYLNVLCRQSGITVRSTIDLLIVQTVIDNNLYLLHKDTDFVNIAKVVPKLKIYRQSFH
ncbi:MAG: PIN domain nuclease [Anaerolineae bacterium]|nr:PIN domain nuclease [Anaerolineae bacterium]